MLRLDISFEVDSFLCRETISLCRGLEVGDDARSAELRSNAQCLAMFFITDMGIGAS